VLVDTRSVSAYCKILIIADSLSWIGFAGFDSLHGTGFDSLHGTGYDSLCGTGYDSLCGTGYNSLYGTKYDTLNGTGYDRINDKLSLSVYSSCLTGTSFGINYYSFS
jgi:hypothetical protein